MREVNLSENKFDILMEYYLLYKDYGHFKHLFEISVTDKEYDTFLAWLEVVDVADLDFAFFVIDRYSGFKLIYGFSNFYVSERLKTKHMDFQFENNDILRKNLYDWYKECETILLSDSLDLYLKVIQSK